MASTTDEQHSTRAIVAATIGAALEWYDFTLYGLASALAIGPVFFPSENPATGLLISFATFGVGFLARPFGGFVLGHFGDRNGRRNILVLTLVLMSVSTFCIGLLPSYAAGGLLGAVLLVLLRIGQGFGAGAEYAGATLLAAEYAPDRRRGLLSAIPSAGAPIGAICAALVFGAFATLRRDAFLSWGWRIPFLLSAVLFVVGLYIRTRVAETPVFVQQQLARPTEKRAGVFTLLRLYPIPLLKGVMLSAGPNASSYLPAVYALSYLANTRHLPATLGTNALVLGNVSSIIMLPLAGHISDRLGRRAVFIFGALLAAAMAFPFFSLLDTGNILAIWAGYLLLFTVAGCCMLGTQTSLLPELFPTEVRYTGIAVSRELAAALVGGTLPFIAAAIVAATGSTTGISILVIAVTLVAAAGAFLMREGRGKSLLSIPQRDGLTLSDGQFPVSL